MKVSDMKVPAIVVTMIGWLVCAFGADDTLDDIAWRGHQLFAWIKDTPRQCKNVWLEAGILKATVIGKDAQFYALLDLKPVANHIVILRMKSACGGRGQLFWIPRDKKSASEERQASFNVIGDNEWHDYRIRPGWAGMPLSQLRLDPPPGSEGGYPIEIASVVVTRDGEAVDIDTKKSIGVSFELQMPKGLHYCTVVWSTENGPGEFGFTTATDGKKHSYWFDLRNARIQDWGARQGRPCWTGRVQFLSVNQVRYNRELPIEKLTFVDHPPLSPADPVMTSASPGEAIPRAGRPFPVEVVVRNFGTRPVENLSFAFDCLPAGVNVLNPKDLLPTEPIPGADGTETIWSDCRPGLVQERVYRFVLSDLGVGRHRLGLTLTAKEVAARRIEIEVDVKPSLGLARAKYPAEPKPVSTAPYEIGAFLFPGWTTHRWHGVWSHAPWRKPVLGWYDEEKGETIDWQIKHMVENGISYVLVDWYWNRGYRPANHWTQAFGKAKFRRYLKWSVMWANHNGRGSHSVADQENVTKFWIENYFSDPQYQTMDGMPVVTIWDPRGMEEDMKGQGGCKALLEVSQRIARESGYKGVYFMAVRDSDSEDPVFLNSFSEKGFRRTCVYKYLGGVSGCPIGHAGSRPYKWLADSSLSHWRALKRNSTLPFLPSLSTAWDDRPWRGEVGWEITDVNASDFRRICIDAKTYADETGDRILLLGPLDEWGEGSIGYPNAEHGFGMLEAVRDVFGRRPESGWPINYAPEDVGLVCPQRLK